MLPKCCTNINEKFKIKANEATFSHTKVFSYYIFHQIPSKSLSVNMRCTCAAVGCQLVGTLLLAVDYGHCWTLQV